MCGSLTHTAIYRDRVELEWRVAAVVVALAAGFLAWWLVQRGRGVLKTSPTGPAIPTAVAHLAGERLTLVQVSSEHCSACVRGARVWRDSIENQPGLAFVEVDAADHMALVRDLGILTTPTTLVYDGAGRLSGRVTGAPTPKAATAVVEPDQDGALR